VAGAASSPLRALREATHARHQVLDAAMPLARFIAGPAAALDGPAALARDGGAQAAISSTHAAIATHAANGAARAAGLASYRDHLRLLAAWLAPLEAWLARFDDGPQGAGAPPALARMPLIAADLADIEAAASELLRTAQDWPAPESGEATPAFRFGVCYVIEGSQLGGAMLLRKLAPLLAPHPLRYLQGAMDRTVPPGPRWQQFLKALDQQVRSDADIAQCVAGACAAFDRLLELLRANPALGSSAFAHEFAAPARRKAA
jgi:heme oxygenase